MKRGLIITAAALATTTLAFTTAGAKELIYGSWVSPKHPVMAGSLPILFKGVAKDTGGAITWKMVAGGQLMNGRGTVAAIKDGIADAGMPIPSYTPSDLPATNSIFSTLVFGEDIVAAGGATAEMLLLRCPECLSEIRRSNAVVLGSYSASPFKLICRKPVRSLAELKGKKVRSSGGGVYLMKAAGATPVAMSPAKATTALQRGTIDCVLGAPSWLKSYGYQDVAKHILDYPLGMVGPVLSMYFNRATWNGLSLAQKKAHLKYAPRVIAHSVITAYKLRDEAIIASAKKIGVTLYPGGPEFKALVEKRNKAQRVQNVANAKKFGVKNADKIAEDFLATLKKWSKLSKEIGSDTAKYEAILQREIYNKLDVTKL